MRAVHFKGKVILVFGVLILTLLYLYNRSSTESSKIANLSRDQIQGKNISTKDRKTRNFSSIYFENHQESSSSSHQKMGNSILPRYKMVNKTSARRGIRNSTSLLKPLNTTSKHTHQTVPHHEELLAAKPLRSVLVNSTAHITKQNIHQKENSTLQNQFHLKKCSYMNNFHFSEDTGQYIRQSPSKTKFKFYIYDLPSKFNSDIVKCFDSEKPKCFFLDHCGMGPEFTDYNSSTVVRDTHMFAAEVILHNKLRFSPHRTLDPDQANMFYIPAYIGLHCLCSKRKQTVSDLLNDLYAYLKRQIYFSTVPHFTTVGKISREMADKMCPYLNHRDSVNVTFLGIELEPRKHLREVIGFADRKFIQIPYPSYVHFQQNQLRSKTQQKRNIFILLAAGSQVNPYRAKIINQFHVKTRRSYYDFKSSQHHLPTKKHPGADNSTMVLFQTDTCSKSLRQFTIPWMEHSVFCLQPPGDSPTRKSFFDSILSGCIPVLFPYPPYLNNPYPFQSVLNYTKFMVTIQHERITIRNESVLHILKELSPLTIQNLQLNLAKVARWLQYSLPNGQIQPHNDAIKLIIQELKGVVSPDHT